MTADSFDGSRDIIFEVKYQSAGDDAVRHFSSHRDPGDAAGDAAMMNARRLEKTRYWVEPRDVTGAFLPPSLPKPRDRFTQAWEQRSSRPGCWDVTDAAIHDMEDRPGVVVATYHRDYPGTPPFEPFRQRGDGTDEMNYALVSPHYMGTSVIDLSTGNVIAEESQDDPAYGFCPVGFYVPDWHDINDGSVIPGSHWWHDSDEQPSGQYGFVWGCYWGDDNGWKAQFLDLSRVADGIIIREDRWPGLVLDTRLGDPAEMINVSHDGFITFSTVVTHRFSPAAREEA
jgi:hypothetical protein